MHQEWIARPAIPWRRRSGESRRVDAAPRGHAKSTVETFFRPAWNITFGREALVIVVSSTQTQADGFTSDLYDLFTSDRYNAWFGRATIAGGKTDFVVRSPYGPDHGTRVLARSAGQQLRGVKHAGWRPTAIILDDIESLANTATADRRRKIADYIDRDVLQAGDRLSERYTEIRAIGTILHPDAWLAGRIGSPGWEGRRWRAIERWPTHPERWEELRRLWADLTIGADARHKALRLQYRARRDWYDEGGDWLWRRGTTLLDLHEILWTDGEWAFWAEMQNEPRTTRDGIFDVATLKRCRRDGRTVILADGRQIARDAYDVAVWLDPIPPSAAGDWAAIAVVARERHAGYRMVLECELFRGPPSEQVARLWRAVDRWGTDASYGYEDNGFQAVIAEYWERSKVERKAARLPHDVTLLGEASTTSKEARVARLQPPSWHGHLQWDVSLSPDVLGQLRDFPGGAHDDAIDAIERADWLLVGRTIEPSQPRWTDRQTGGRLSDRLARGTA